MRTLRPWTAGAACIVATVVCVSVSSCVRFSEPDTSPFSELPKVSPPSTSTPPPPSARKPVNGQCKDPDPSVIICKTDPIMALISMGNDVIVAGKSGAIVDYNPARPQPVWRYFVPVDDAGDGGLLDLALSPNYPEDGALYAYITTPTDNRVVRIIRGDVPKPIVTGIPKGAIGNVGSLRFAGKNTMLVATADGGDPASAAAPTSLAGKLLEVTNLTSGNTDRPKIIARGFGSHVSMCIDPVNPSVWVADQAETADRLQRFPLEFAHGTDQQQGAIVWTWPSKPGLAGCTADGGQIRVSETASTKVEQLVVKKGAITPTDPPSTVVEKTYGRLSRMTTSSDKSTLVGTINKVAGKPGPWDDRVFVLPEQGNGESLD